ncbi:Sulfhydryl oxidase 1 [Toxocara canis]|uniref:Sulfhydryl oxidase n=1 Tax=Toxocara canis TaxID=6265 RepID=A0A0B2VQ64_TOXCA|nr:Sulfhydryl oxidase 1 [Toxocara canis]
MRHFQVRLIALLISTAAQCNCFLSNASYVPLGSSPLLYQPGVDPIVQLDYATFADTIFAQNHAFVVEFYADWCGHCRAFAPHYREFAERVKSWRPIVTVAAINCAEQMNQELCIQQNIYGYPMVKYYPRNARHASDAIVLDLSQHSASSLRTQLARAILNEYNNFHYSDWPNFSHLRVSGDMTYGELWNGVHPSANHLAVLFEQLDSVGGPFLLEMWPSRHIVGARRALATSPLASMLRITRFPYVALFRRDQQQAVLMKMNYAIVLDLSQHSASSLRTQLARAILNEYNNFHYSDWPNFSHLRVSGDMTYGELWNGVHPSANHLAVLFEQLDSVGGPFLLEMWPSRHIVGARRALATSPLASMLRITRFPYVALFRRDQQQAVLMKMYSDQSIEELIRYASPSHHRSAVTKPHPIVATTQAPFIDCDKYPQRCRRMYFVSETDMLKAMRIALVDEVIKTSHYIRNENFAALLNFVSLLAEHFPIYTLSSDLPKQHRRSRQAPSVLKSSSRARSVFAHMREFLHTRKRQMTVSAGEWHYQFVSTERLFGSPFPRNASWEHCKGSTPQFRGYTCGLWTTFHALTVNAYLDSLDEQIDPLMPLNSIKGWVSTFFGCLHCRRHFHHMTTKLFPMNGRRVRQASDMMMYLWRAHNIVNRRLHNDPTEDPQFKKRQFPAAFLCPTCRVGNDHFSKKEIRRFLLRYYGSIRAGSPTNV